MVLKDKRLILFIVFGLIVVNSVFVASTLSNLAQHYFFSSGHFVFQYDDSKLAIDRVGGFSYDVEGLIEELTVYVRNKDPVNSYVGSIEATVNDQGYTLAISLGPGTTRGYEISLNPHLTALAPIVLDVSVLVAGGEAGADLLAQRGAAIGDASIDGTIGAEWEDAKSYTNVPITPSGTASIWVKNDGANLYVALQFTADSSNPWVAFQLGATGCHPNGVDGALFGDDHYAATGYRDIRYIPEAITMDGVQNGVGAMVVGAGNRVTIEYKKPLNSGDAAGGDVVWGVGSTYSLVIAWDSNGGGSSGGSTSHRSASPLVRTIQIGA